MSMTLSKMKKQVSFCSGRFFFHESETGMGHSFLRKTSSCIVMRTMIIGAMLISIPCSAQQPAPPQANSASSSPGFRAALTSETATIQDGDTPVLVYQRAPRSLAGKWTRSHYIHPLYDLEGQPITEDFPPDHLHHRGIFWAWHQVLVDGVPQGDPWLCQNFTWDVRRLRVEVDPAVVRLQAIVLWRPGDVAATAEQTTALAPPASRRAILRERTDIHVHPVEQEELSSYRCIDFQIRLQPLVAGLAIGGSDDTKGYGGFSARIRMDRPLEFSGRTGPVEPQVNQIHAGPWMNFAWPEGGMLILNHPDNPNSPQPWILRRQKSMQNAAFPGRSAYAIPQDQPLKLRYRIVIYRGTLSTSAIENLYKDYENSH
ncbi:MAG: hypothetical protein D6753_17580 [Planctomycetota bacterium]|nr:MAG: hypothetical protein D6753_17580 [Planctomycetota bacterium]